MARLQQALIDAGYDPGEVDGIFGPRTQAAVEEFQGDHGLVVDGIAGRRTLAALDEVAQASDREEPGEAGDVGDLDDEVSPTSVQTIDWAAVDGGERMRYVMELLVEQYDYPINGAAGIVGNLWAESGVLPHRIQGSRPDSPLRAKDFEGNTVDFTAEQVMNRDKARNEGPVLAGVGLAQWTSPARRSGLFEHAHEGVRLGADALFDMEAQVDYLVHELRQSYLRVQRLVTEEEVTVDKASDEILYNFEIPGSILEGGRKLPRTDPRVEEVFHRRRAHAERARREYP